MLFFLVITLLRHYLNTGESEEQILKMGTTLCIKMKMQTPRVCEQGIHLFGAEIIKIAKRIDMTASDICYFFLDEICIDISEHESHKWNVSIPPLLKPKVTDIQLPKENAHKLKVLHISDTHLDPLYVEGSNAYCNEPLCCRANDGMTNISFSAAKKWGEYRCDLPKRTFEHLLDHIAETHKVTEHTNFHHDTFHLNITYKVFISTTSFRILTTSFGQAILWHMMFGCKPMNWS